jgi:hypothetical protein
MLALIVEERDAYKRLMRKGPAIGITPMYLIVDKGFRIWLGVCDVTGSEGIRVSITMPQVLP